MKIKNYILSALVALPLVAGLASCSEKGADYDAASVIAGNEVYFASVSETVELSTEASTTSIGINRIKTADAISVPLVVTSTSSDIKVASEAKFAAGEAVGKIDITYDPAKVAPGVYDTLTVAINDPAYVTPYGASTVTVLIGQAEPWVSLGWGQFIDNFMWEGVYVDVEIEQNQLKPNQYRVVDPYKDITAKANRDPYFYFTVHSAGEMLIESKDYKAPFDGFVTYDNCNTGYYYGDGYGYYMPMCPCIFSVGRNETVEALNCVKEYFDNGDPAYITLTSVYGLSDYGGAWNYATSEGLIQVVMPGYELTDYSAEVAYAGKFITADEQVFAVANITLGADVVSAKYAISAGDASNEGLENAEANGVEISASGEYRIPMPEGAENGAYTIYVVTYDEVGEAQNYGYATFKYQAGAVVEQTWTPLYFGTWTYSLYAFCNEDGSPYDDENLVLSICDQDESMYKISHLWNDVEFIFSLDEEGYISFENQFTGANYGYGDLWAYDAAVVAEGDKGYYANGAFNFDVAYYDDQYNWGVGFETFKLTGKYTAAEAKARKVAAKKHVVKKNAEMATPMSLAGINLRGKSIPVSNGVRNHKMSNSPIK